MRELDPTIVLASTGGIVNDQVQEIQFRDIFESTQYKAYFEDSVREEYEDLVYSISRGKYDEVLIMYKELEVQLDEYLRPTGDTIMHVCAEYG